MKLAYEVVKINFGEKEAKEAQDNFVSTIQKKEAPKEIDDYVISERTGILDILNNSGLTASKGEARRLIVQGGIKIDGEQVKDLEFIIDPSESGVVLQRGKLKFIRVVKG